MTTGFFSAEVADRQIDAQAEHSVRQQRHALYTQLIQDEEALLQAEISFWNLFQHDLSLDYPTGDNIQQRKATIDVAKLRYDISSSSANLIGAEDTSQNLLQLKNNHIDFYRIVDRAFLDAMSGNTSRDKTSEIETQLDSIADVVSETHNELLALLRRDIAIK